MPVVTEQTGDFPSTSFVMDNVSEVLNDDTSIRRERRDVPAGVYPVQVCNVYPREYFDKPDCFDEDPNRPMPDAIVKRLIPLEIIEGEYANERILLSVYIEPDEEKYSNDDKGRKRYGTHQAKFNMGRKRIAKLAKACGLDSVTDLDDCVGKFVEVTLKKKDGWVNLETIEPYGIAKPTASFRQEPKPEPAAEQATEQEVKDDIPF